MKCVPIKGKTLFPLGADTVLLKKTHFEKGEQKNSYIVASQKVYSFQFHLVGDQSVFPQTVDEGLNAWG